MKFYISYFYQIRNFDKSIIPISTALYDPKWFHQGKDNNYIFKDKNGVYNGIRAEILNPSKCTGCPCKSKDPDNCEFLSQYRSYLNSLNFASFIMYCKEIANQVSSLEQISDPSIALIVYETPNNKCSERSAIIEWFNQNGCQITEFIP